MELSVRWAWLIALFVVFLSVDHSGDWTRPYRSYGVGVAAAQGPLAGEPVPQPAGEPVPQPAGEPVPQPAGEPVPQPAGEPVPQLAGEPVPQPVGEPVPQPVGEPVLQPAQEPQPVAAVPASAPMEGPSMPPEMTPNYEDDESIINGEIIVKVKPRENPYGLDLEVKKVLGSLGETFAVAKVPQNETIASTLVKAMSRPEVEYAEPNRIWKTNVEPNDSRWSTQWNMRMISAPGAWDTQKGSDSVRVCVIDTGIDYNHKDLETNMVSGSLKTGYNAITSQANCMDGNGHGTHCAGVIGAVTDNSQGIAGINWNIELVGCKFLSDSGSGSTSDAIECLQWCVNNASTPISSNSWGGSSFSTALRDAIKAAGENNNHLFVTAAGNSGYNLDNSPEYPAAYALPNIIPVASTDSEDKLSYFSNYSPQSVPIAAPGSSILSTTHNNRYTTYSGTSMACPHVAGTAALMLAENAGLRYAEITGYMIQGADTVNALLQLVAGGKRLNVLGAINAVKGGAPIPSPSPPPPLPPPPPPVPLGFTEIATLTPSQYPFLSSVYNLNIGSTDSINPALADKCPSEFSVRLQASQYKKLIFKIDLSQYSSSGALEIDDCVQPSGVVDTMMVVFKCPTASGDVNYASCTCYADDDGCGPGKGEIVTGVPFSSTDVYYTILVPYFGSTTAGEIQLGIKDSTVTYPPPPLPPPPPPGNVGVMPFDESMTANSTYPQVSVSYDLSSGTTRQIDKTFLSACAEDVTDLLQSDRKKLIVQVKGLPSGGSLTVGDCYMTTTWDSVSIALYCPENSIVCKCFANDDGCGTFAGGDKISNLSLESGYVLYYIVMGYSPSTSSGQFKLTMDGSSLTFPSPPPLPSLPPPPSPPPPSTLPIPSPSPPASGAGGGGGGGGGIIATPQVPEPQENNDETPEQDTPQQEDNLQEDSDTAPQEEDSGSPDTPTPDLSPDVVDIPDVISPVVSMSVKLKLPGNTSCDSLSGSDKKGIESNFCKKIIVKKGLEGSNVQCTSSLSCSSARQSNSDAIMKTSLKVVNKDLKSIDSANDLALQIKSSLDDIQQLSEVLDEVLPGVEAVSVESIQVQEADLPPQPPPPPRYSPTYNPPESTSSASPQTCEYDGYYTIKPLYRPCSKYYLAYKYPRCKPTSVTMKRYKQVRSKPKRIHWKIDSKNGISSITGRERTDCKALSLSAPSKVSKGLRLGGSSWKWKIIPRKTSDCSKVNLYAYSPKRRGYLAVSDGDKGCAWAYSKAKNAKPTMFRLTKRTS